MAMQAFWDRQLAAIYSLIQPRQVQDLRTSLRRLEERLAAIEELEKARGGPGRLQAIHVPAVDLAMRANADGFMRYSTCSAADLLHPRCTEVAALYTAKVNFHRKFWETIYILNCGLLNGVGPGRRALGFGVGGEPIPAVFAKLGADIVATDAPPEIGIANGWTINNEFASGLDNLYFEGVVDRPTLQRHVTFRTCDMNSIAEDLVDFDFCWSACCLEHLGSLQHGMDFIINSVEKTLKIGGIACHTTELNLSSNEHTIERGGTVLYRKRDLDALVATLRDRGHAVDDITIAPDTHHLDGYVDVPPYTVSPHLKLLIENYTCTSVGLIIKRGR